MINRLIECMINCLSDEKFGNEVLDDNLTTIECRMIKCRVIKCRDERSANQGDARFYFHHGIRDK